MLWENLKIESMSRLTIRIIPSLVRQPEHIRYVAHLVDEKLREMGRKSTGLDTTRKSILTAVNIMHEKVKLEEENRKLLQEIQQLKQKRRIDDY